MFAVARAARVCGGAFVAVTGLAVGQAVLHEASYTPLPERRFRTTGLELPAFARQCLAAKREELLAQHELLKQKRDALSALAVLRQAELRERLRELRETQPLESLRRKAVEHAKDRWRTLLDTFAPRGECDGEDFSGRFLEAVP
ncbi:hypothetical protein M885DRAFT_567892 [Pelagophyceae sp. CCMP2097]|nr:hypothetical protein M885DRAFT_567892 [Pelagophyceae sp. CCMP2097]